MLVETCGEEIRQQCTYGVNIVGPYDNGYRNDTYIAKDGGKHYERRACAGKDDESEIAHDFTSLGLTNGNIKYHPACPCCWLGHSHTVNYHNRAIQGHAVEWWTVPPGKETW